MTILVVTAVAAEADAFRAGAAPDRFEVVVAGVGPAAAAAAAARLLATRPYTAVVSAGIAGGLRAPIGATVVGVRAIAADLGAETDDGFVAVDALGFGTTVATADESLLKTLTSALPAAITGDILTVSTVTGSAATAARLAAAHPAAVAEAMEGYGVACAAAGAAVPFAELRTVSNPVGPRDRAAWRLTEAFAALTAAAAALSGHPEVG